MCRSGGDFDTVRAAYVTFLRALFQEALALMQTKFNKTTALSLQWYEFMQTGILHDKQSPNREMFYQKVVATASELVRHLYHLASISIVDWL